MILIIVNYMYIKYKNVLYFLYLFGILYFLLFEVYIVLL